MRVAGTCRTPRQTAHTMRGRGARLGHVPVHTTKPPESSACRLVSHVARFMAQQPLANSAHLDANFGDARGGNVRRTPRQAAAQTMRGRGARLGHVPVHATASHCTTGMPGPASP